MRDCDNETLRDRLPDLLHERLSDAERRRVQTHLDACAACAGEWRVLRAARLTLDAAAPRVDVDAIAAAVAARMASERVPALRVVRGDAPPARPIVRHRSVWSSTQLRAAAAVVVMALGAGGVFVAGRGEVPSIPVVSAPTNVARAPVADAPAAAAPDPAAMPPSRPTVASADPATEPASALGATFSDLSDEELAAVIRAVDSDAGLPAVDSSAAPTLVTSGDVL